MKRLLFLSLLSLSLFVSAWAQVAKMNPALLMELKKIDRQNIALLVKGNPSIVKDFTESHKGLFKYTAGNICSVILPKEFVSLLSENNQVKRLEYYINRTKPLDDTSIIKSNVLKIHNGAAPLTQSYNGSGTIYGMVDTGIDFTHPDFKDSNGKTRVKWLWDQAKPNASNTPQPYNYGQEWNNNKIDSGYCTHQDFISYGHGTKVAGVAAGNGNSTPLYKGIAPAAEIMVVAVDFNSNGPTILDGINYIVSKASAENKPFVINLSLGDYYGSHDGNDLQTQAIKALFANIPGRAVVAAAGNAGNVAFHLKYNVTADTNFTIMQNTSSSEFIYGIFADTNNFKNARYTIGVYNASTFQYEGNIGFRKINSCLGTVKADTLRYNGNRIAIIQTAADINAGTYELDIDIQQDSVGYFYTLETTGSGLFDAWDFEYLKKNQLPPTLANIPRMQYYKEPDSLQTICTGFQCSEEVITVANYTERTGFISLGGAFSPQPGPYDTLAYNSSRGPTRDGKIKPDITSPGDNIVTPGNVFFCHDNAVNYPGPGIISEDTLHMKFDGTSAASPGVAGVALLYLQKNPSATNHEIRDAIRNCALQDHYTGSNLPNVSWGYGKLDGFNALLCNQTMGVSKNIFSSGISVYPNPAQTQLTFIVPNEKETDINMYSVLGEKVKIIHASSTNISVPVSDMAKGLYLYEVYTGTQLISKGKFIKE